MKTSAVLLGFGALCGRWGVPWVGKQGILRPRHRPVQRAAAGWVAVVVVVGGEVLKVLRCWGMGC